MFASLNTGFLKMVIHLDGKVNRYMRHVNFVAFVS
jgi:hypothetical protein